eukprot:COSAG01_NODE_2323_length_7908_cov_43.508388_5_plen_185_part_00
MIIRVMNLLLPPLLLPGGDRHGGQQWFASAGAPGGDRHGGQQWFASAGALQAHTLCPTAPYCHVPATVRPRHTSQYQARPRHTQQRLPSSGGNGGAAAAAVQQVAVPVQLQRQLGDSAAVPAWGGAAACPRRASSDSQSRIPSTAVALYLPGALAIRRVACGGTHTHRSTRHTRHTTRGGRRKG